MDFFSIRPTKGRSIPKVKAGQYEATIVDVTAAENFAPGQAFVLHYELVCDEGTIPYTEKLLNDTHNSRTRRFDQQTKAAGFNPNDLDALIGTRWNLDIFYEAEYGRSFLNVISRTYLPPVVEDEDPEEVADAQARTPR